MILLNPKLHNRKYRDEKTRDLMQKTIDFLENKGLKKNKRGLARKKVELRLC